VVVAPVTLTYCLFQGNSAGLAGGGLFDQTQLPFLIYGSQFIDNQAALGAGLYDQATGDATNVVTGLTIANSTFTGNRSEFLVAPDDHRNQGGAVVLQNTYSNAVFVNDTFASNVAGSSYEWQGQGGAIFLLNTGSTLTLVNDTIAGNSVSPIGEGAGIYQASGTLVVQNTIIADNTVAGLPSDYFYKAGTLTDGGGYILSSSNGTYGLFGAGTLFADPKLAPLLDNGGPHAGSPSTAQVVRTEAPLPGSPAFGRAVAAGAPISDERGFPRPGGRTTTAAAAGAYEPRYASDATVNTVFVENLYDVLLGRPGDAPGVAAWVNVLGSGVPTINATLAFEGSPEFLVNQVNSLFQRYLFRASSTADVASLSRYLQAGHTLEQAAAILVGSPEFYARAAGNPATFVEAAYMTVLGRVASNDDRLGWQQAMADGQTTSFVGAAFLASIEYLTAVVSFDFVAFLGRPANLAATSAFRAAMMTGSFTSFTTVAAILGSSESFNDRT
jgi:hypothetical protein